MDSVIHQLCQQIAALPEEREAIIHLSARLYESVDPLRFLVNNSDFRQFYWRGRDQLTLACLDCCVEHEAIAPGNGSKAQLHSVQSVTAKEHKPLYLSAFSFNGLAGQEIWQGFPAEYSVLPQICLLERQGAYSLHLYLKPEPKQDWNTFTQQVIKKLQSVNWSAETPSVSNREPDNQSSSIGRKEWGGLCEQVQGLIQNSPLEKVVLARQLGLQLKHANPQSLLTEWLKSNSESYGFMVQLQGKTFLGCSPERLYQRVGRQLYTESLAGTVRRGKDHETDQALAARLLSEPKLVKEHALVSDFIRQQLGPLTERMEMGEVQSWPLDHIRHAYQQISAQLTDEISDRALIDALHPTPAICGYPRKEAGRFIQENEGLERGWYSGGIGIVGDDYADYAVAIRSAIIENNTLHCYSGVGLVEGADADQEWQELDAKLESLLTVLYAKG